ncbi:hypothetical protein MMYC01_206706 [Madurella mycetomatis]|uniref:Uncharacterized protein n=1 Tax=Madurella mycetomatis TaxID=100816 RepID=A0A175W2S9_9PEZI|nr:hypothetical protein MMYC01_206706 [Madurella mycetomatis]
MSKGTASRIRHPLLLAHRTPTPVRLMVTTGIVLLGYQSQPPRRLLRQNLQPPHPGNASRTVTIGTARPVLQSRQHLHQLRQTRQLQQELGNASPMATIGTVHPVLQSRQHLHQLRQIRQRQQELGNASPTAIIGIARPGSQSQRRLRRLRKLFPRDPASVNRMATIGTVHPECPNRPIPRRQLRKVLGMARSVSPTGITGTALPA